MKQQFNISLNREELETMICGLRDQRNRLEESLIHECTKPEESCSDEILFYASELSKTTFLLNRFEEINDENNLSI